MTEAEYALLDNDPELCTEEEMALYAEDEIKLLVAGMIEKSFKTDVNFDVMELLLGNEIDAEWRKSE